jgi:hypothetical protein
VRAWLPELTRETVRRAVRLRAGFVDLDSLVFIIQVVRDCVAGLSTGRDPRTTRSDGLLTPRTRATAAHSKTHATRTLARPPWVMRLNR